jgi:hypothetical protein
VGAVWPLFDVLFDGVLRHGGDCLLHVSSLDLSRFEKAVFSSCMDLLLIDGHSSVVHGQGGWWALWVGGIFVDDCDPESSEWLDAVLNGEPGSVMSLEAVLLPLQSVQLSTATPLKTNDEIKTTNKKKIVVVVVLSFVRSRDL